MDGQNLKAEYLPTMSARAYMRYARAPSKRHIKQIAGGIRRSVFVWWPR